VFGVEGGEFIALGVIALLVLGPEKLPRYAADAAKFMREARRMANSARADVRRELGPELQGISLEDLNPKTALRKHVLDDIDLDDEPGTPVARPPDRATGQAPAGGGGPAVPPPYDPDAT
jgi:sec-independent protein translocase protein TatB